MTYRSFYSCFSYLFMAVIRFVELVVRDVRPIFNPTLHLNPALVAVSSPAPAAVRSFWSRITARSDDPVPRTI
ncbi:hypothetical protein EVC26_077 [Rhizobium phage RHph_I72]|nr:hypothetical protein EVC13_075 [Rhizobium phage RHph_I65]QIG76523.1 hypothetical protein EVC26_077 [Rhizobium phage RHph_I72]